VLLYDADRIEAAAGVPDAELVQAQRELIQDPGDPAVAAAARQNGISDAMLEAALRSPVYQFVKRWQIALPLHPEFRTLPMLFYVPPLLPVLATVDGGRYNIGGAAGNVDLAPALSSLDQARVPLRYMASLFAAGNQDVVRSVYRKLIAVRMYMRAKQVGDVGAAAVEQALQAGQATAAEAEAIFRLTAMPTFEQRFVLPPLGREQAIEATEEPFERKQEGGFGIRQPAERRF